MPKPTAVNTTNSDAGGDNPQVARENILDLMQKFNALVAQLSEFIWGLLSSADAAAARAAMGAASASATVNLTGAQTVGDLKTFSGGVVSSSAAQPLGYATGAGGSYTQVTSKTTNVNIARPSGQITTAAGSIPAGGSVDFSILGGGLINSGTLVVLSHTSPVSTAYRLECMFVGTGQAVIRMTNTSGSALNEVTTFNYALLRVATS